jgi:hypothetical protein
MKTSMKIVAAALVLLGSAFFAAAQARTQDESMTVMNSNGESVGTIKNFLIDGNGNIAFVVVSHDRMAGGCQKDIAVPIGAFAYDREKDQVVLDISQQQLDSAPEFTASALNDPSFAGRMYEYFGQAPAWTHEDAQSDGLE